MSIIDKLKSAKDRRVPKTLTVKTATNLTPNMRRVTLHGKELSSFPKDAEGAYIKLLFNQPGVAKPTMRTYTVAEQRYEQNEIDVDFMLHNSNENSTDHGIAAHWSLGANIGDIISVAGPGPAKFINIDADYFLLAGDMTALPALTANLKRLPKNAKGKAFIEILSEADKQDLAKPDNVELHWVINDKPGSDESPLFNAIEKAHLTTEKLATWIACEFKTMKKIRQYLKEECSVERSHLYISSYWKKGNTEEQHKKAKPDDAKLVTA